MAVWLRKSELKAKKLSSLLADKISEDRELMDDLREEADLLTDVEKGIVMEALSQELGKGSRAPNGHPVPSFPTIPLSCFKLYPSGGGVKRT